MGIMKRFNLPSALLLGCLAACKPAGDGAPSSVAGRESEHPGSNLIPVPASHAPPVSRKKDPRLDARLLAAMERGERGVIERLLEEGADIHARDTDGDSPILLAIHFGHLELLEFLLGRGAQVNDRNNYQWTPLHFAAVQGRMDMARLLLARGAELNAREVDGITPFRLAQWAGHKEMEAWLAGLGGVDYNAD